MTAVSSRHLAFRREIIATCRQLGALGLNQGTSGNVSVRVADGFLLTPTSLDYEAMKPADIVHVRADGTCVGARRPSSELPFHRAIMDARPDVRAIIHTHSTHATAVSCLRRGIPALHYLVALFGGADIRCARYATFGTDALSRNLVRALAGRRAALLANHGLVVVGDNLAHALSLTVEAEQLARLCLATLATGVKPAVLGPAEMARVAKRFRAYGYRPVP
ncbi:MAG: class II aldolase/adducin family protein [Opitutaceae bacterium]|nr:class II aldolase/adducin family protein [Opitutaceae bacterium]